LSDHRGYHHHIIITVVVNVANKIMTLALRFY